MTTELSADIVRLFLEATTEFLTEMGAEVKSSQLTKANAADDLHGEISGLMGIAAESYIGSVAISFPQPTFLKIVSFVLDQPVQVINKDIIDGAGEFMNVIYGKVKGKLNKKGMGIKAALPTIIFGNKHSLSYQTKTPRNVITFESTFGKFSVEIFLAKPAEDSVSQSKIFGKKTVDSKDGYNILVVDDSKMARDALTSSLNGLNFKALQTAENGQLAWEKIEQANKENNPFNIIFLDWNMPVMDGLTLTKKIRENTTFNDLKIAMITAECDADNVKLAKDSGVDYFLHKPFGKEKMKLFMEKMEKQSKKAA